MGWTSKTKYKDKTQIEQAVWIGVEEVAIDVCALADTDVCD